MINRLLFISFLAFSLADYSRTPLTLFAETSSAVRLEDFGVTGDGVSDDTASVVAAIAAACQGPHSLRIPAGTFLISDTLALCTGLHLSGESSHSSRLVKTNAGPVLSMDTVKNIIVERIAIQGGGHGDGTSHGVTIARSSSISLRDVVVTLMAGNGVHLSRVVHVNILDSKISGNQGDGLYSESGGTVTVERCYINSNKGNGMTAAGTQNSRYIAVVFEENSGYGAVLGGTGVFLGNYFEANKNKALRVTNCCYLIAGNMLLGAEMEVVNSTNNTIVANQFGTVPVGRYHILLDSRSNDNWIGNNRGATEIQDLGARNVWAAPGAAGPRNTRPDEH